jgi:aspartyl/asparaginyl-tRNA synthetase
MKKSNYRDNYIDPQDFNELIIKLRKFFLKRGFKETFPQPKLTILAACEDPKTVKSFNFDNNKWPLPQTNQMNLEEELMIYQDKLDGVFCLTASYRDEPNPIEDRHMKTFPMFEAEHKGNFDHLIQTISECCVYLGLVDSVDDIPIFTYDDLCEYYGVNDLKSEHEELIWKEYGDVVAITYFPERTSPFFNMKDHGINKYGEKTSRKVDFIVCGQETFGCAERENDPDIMRRNFHTISDGEYAGLLYNKFGEDRVKEELEDFLSLPMIERWGFGCGITRLSRAMKIKNLLTKNKEEEILEKVGI